MTYKVLKTVQVSEDVSANLLVNGWYFIHTDTGEHISPVELGWVEYTPIDVAYAPEYLKALLTIQEEYAQLGNEEYTAGIQHKLQNINTNIEMGKDNLI